MIFNNLIKIIFIFYKHFIFLSINFTYINKFFINIRIFLYFDKNIYIFFITKL